MNNDDKGTFFALAEQVCAGLCPKDRDWLGSYIAAFYAYTSGYITGYPADALHHRLKQEHTLQVLGVAVSIVTAEPVFTRQTLRRAALLSALFHDVGRFEQFRQHHTFADALSVNHGTLGLSVLIKEGFLANEPRPLRAMVHCGVGVHNAFTVPASVHPDKRLVLQAVRDADKIDILRVMGEHLGPGKEPDRAVVMHLADKPECVTPRILDSLKQGRIPSYSDMRFINDFRIVICSWVMDMHFPTTRSLLKSGERLAPFVEGLSRAPEAEGVVRQFLLAELVRATSS